MHVFHAPNHYRTGIQKTTFLAQIKKVAGRSIIRKTQVDLRLK